MMHQQLLQILACRLFLATSWMEPLASLLLTENDHKRTSQDGGQLAGGMVILSPSSLLPQPALARPWPGPGPA